MKLIAVALVIVLSAACTYLTPYKLEVQQGTVITPEMVAQLKPGMTRSQVSFVLGTPLLTDSFHPDRWDYIYYVRKRGTLREQRKLALLFDADKLKEIKTDGAVAAVPAADAAPAPKGEAK